MKSSLCRHSAAGAATLHFLVVIIAGLYPEAISATREWVSTETAFRDALADVTVDTVCITSSFALTDSQEIILVRSVNLIGNCSSGSSGSDTPGCTLGICDSGPPHALHIQAAAQEISVHIQGIRFEGTQGRYSSHGAIRCGGAHRSEVLVKDGSFHGLRSENGAAFLVAGMCAVTCENCDFFDNEAVSAGGAVHARYGLFTCSGCSFSGNHAKKGGAIYVMTGGRIELHHPFFTEDVATIGGPDIFIENLPFAALRFCPSSPHPNTTGSPRPPTEDVICASLSSVNDPRGSIMSANTPTSFAPARPSGISANITNLVQVVPAALPAGTPHRPPGFYYYPTWGGSQVPAGHSLGLMGILVVKQQEWESVALNLTFGRGESLGGSCSGFLLDNVNPSQGSCFRAGNTAACTVVCYLGQVQPNDPVSLDMTLRAVTVGAQLVMEATVEALGQARELLPVQVMDAFGVQAEPIRVVDALQPIIAPAQGEAGIRFLAGGPHQHAFAGMARVLHFMVIGPALGGCNLTEAIHLEGAGQVANVTAGVDSTMLMGFEVLAAPDSALVLRVPAGACRGADGQPSMASEPFPLLVDVIKPSVTVTSIGEPSADNDLAVFRIQFSERVSGFSAEGIEVQGGLLTCLSTINASESTYEAYIQIAQDTRVMLLLAVKEGAALDIAGNPSAATNISKILHGHHGPVRLLSTLLKAIGGFGLLMATTENGPNRLVVLVGHLQFFQMISALDVPVGSFLGDVLHHLAWVNNAWPRPLFGMGGAPQDAAFGSSAQHLFFASNGSCRGQAEEDVMTPGNGTLSRRQLGDTTDDGWHYMTLAELDSLLQDNHPCVRDVQTVPGSTGPQHLNSQGDFGAIMSLCLCQLAGCLALRALGTAVWWTMDRLRPSQWWETLPAILLFPRLELLVLMLTFPTVTQASVYYATAGFKWGVLIGACVGAAYPLAFVTFVTYFLVTHILRSDECVFRPERIYLMHGSRDVVSIRMSPRPLSESDDTSVSSRASSIHSSLGLNAASYKKPYLLAASWLDRGANLKRNFVTQ
eukprot:jgi/Mesvir1/25718/Mv01906-RA.2